MSSLLDDDFVYNQEDFDFNEDELNNVKKELRRYLEDQNTQTIIRGSC